MADDKKRVGSWLNRRIKSRNENWLYYVLSDDEFMREVDNLRPYDDMKMSEYEKLAQQYVISITNVLDVVRVGPDMSMFYGLDFNKKGWVFLDEENDLIVFEMDPNIKKQEFMDFWGFIDSQRKKSKGYRPSKNKKPDYLSLVYGVFKARKNGLTYPSIFNLYSEKQLPYYDLENKIFKSSEDLKSYYLNHRPK